MMKSVLLLASIACLPAAAQQCLQADVTKGTLTVSCYVMDTIESEAGSDLTSPSGTKFLLHVKAVSSDPLVVAVRIILMYDAFPNGIDGNDKAYMRTQVAVKAAASSSMGYIFSLPSRKIQFITVEELRSSGPAEKF